MLHLPVRLREQALDVGSEIQALVTHEDLHGKGQSFDERPKAFDDGLLLILRFERQVDGRDLEYGTIAAPGGGSTYVQAEHVVFRLAQAHHVALHTWLFACRLHRASSPASGFCVLRLALSSTPAL